MGHNFNFVLYFEAEFKKLYFVTENLGQSNSKNIDFLGPDLVIDTIAGELGGRLGFVRGTLEAKNCRQDMCSVSQGVCNQESKRRTKIEKTYPRNPIMSPANVRSPTEVSVVGLTHASFGQILLAWEHTASSDI